MFVINLTAHIDEDDLIEDLNDVCAVDITSAEELKKELENKDGEAWAYVMGLLSLTGNRDEMITHLEVTQEKI